ncbi:MAG: hypothetical protein GQ540_11120 [Lutibacter sp.]|uniref:hypothetical protein n=1 Tax=Lutibacter sp. TaxID=1925666 RepID=UPI0019D9E4DA|nr:hypothetical protein [Lutibacter sp.]NOR29066.1 hypothetical protein [Lutibacter sp.]
MDATHLHLMLTHFPIVGTILGIGILIYGQFSKKNEIKKVAFAIFILMSLLTIPVYLTGDGAEETVEHIAGVSENLIERHEEFAENAIVFMAFLGILSLLSFIAIVRKYSFEKTATIVALSVSVVTFAVFVQVGNLGGQIRHSEIQSKDYLNTLEIIKNVKGVDNEKQKKTKKDHDDDDD